MTELVYLNGELFHAEDFSEEALAHYGVPGMKWGKRKSSRPEGVSRRTVRLEKQAARKSAAINKKRWYETNEVKKLREAKSIHANKKVELSKYRDKKKSVGLTKDDKAAIRAIRTDQKNVKATRMVIANNARNAVIVTSAAQMIAYNPTVQKHVAKYGGKVAGSVVRGATKVAPNNFNGRVVGESGRRVYRTAKNFGGNVRLVEPMALPAPRKAIGR